MNYRDLLDYSFYEDNGSYTVVLDKNKLGLSRTNLNEEKDNIKTFFRADNLLVE